MTRKWENYARVKPATRWTRRRRANESIFVSISFWLPNEKPVYASGSHLRYETKESVYYVYNPLRLVFDVNQLISHIKTIHAQMGDPVISWDVVAV